MSEILYELYNERNKFYFIPLTSFNEAEITKKNNEIKLRLPKYEFVVNEQSYKLFIDIIDFAGMFQIRINDRYLPLYLPWTRHQTVIKEFSIYKEVLQEFHRWKNCIIATPNEFMNYVTRQSQYTPSQLYYWT